VSQTGVVTRLALRELWISFRLLLLLAAYVGVGAAVALLPAPPSAMLARLAIAIAAAMAVGAAIAGGSLSRARAVGRAGWLAPRSIPRRTFRVGWLAALTLVSLLGIAAVGVLGWIVTSLPGARLDPVAFGATFAAIACAAIRFLAIGLLSGTLLRPPAAALAAAVVCIALVGATWLAVPRIASPPEALAQLPQLVSPMSVAIQGAGAGLALAAVMMIVARVTMDRVDL
jgi:hypothetical protein